MSARMKQKIWQIVSQRNLDVEAIQPELQRLGMTEVIGREIRTRAVGTRSTGTTKGRGRQVSIPDATLDVAHIEGFGVSNPVWRDQSGCKRSVWDVPKHAWHFRSWHFRS